jgi:hypothetical protein
MTKHSRIRQCILRTAAIAAVVSAFCIGATGCGGGGGGGGGGGTSSISGTVVDLDTQNPVQNALVEVSGSSDTTSASGAFQVTGLLNGPQTLTASANNQGFLPASAQVDVQGATALPAPIQLPRASTGPPPPPGTITGTVSGTVPPLGVTVEAINKATSVPMDSVTLLAPGAYGLLVPGAATYTVRASGTGVLLEQDVALPNLGDTASGVNFAIP